MIKLLLDFPWRIDAALNADPRPLHVMRDFLSLLAHVPFEPVRFVYQDEVTLFYEELRGHHGRWVAEVIRFLSHVEAQEQGGAHHAIPLNGPNDVRHPWQIALRDEMGDLSNWRTPQIIVCADRSQLWEQCVQDHEAAIALEDHPNEGAHRRVVVVMQSYDHKQVPKYQEDYRAHKYALADVDPWDLRRKHPAIAGGRLNYPARLPKPPELEAIKPHNLQSEIDEARKRSWRRGGRFYYIPPGIWEFTQVNQKHEWRSGAFPVDRARNGRGPGPLDYLGQIWDWDEQERHWDVQLTDGTYLRITHEGVWRQ